MGLGPNWTVSSWEEPKKLPNPDPKRFKIKKISISDSSCIAVKINYPDCTNYEGDKIMIFEKRVWRKIRWLGVIDPHFTNKGYSPIARFEPTMEGWKNALKFLEILK